MGQVGQEDPGKKSKQGTLTEYETIHTVYINTHTHSRTDLWASDSRSNEHVTLARSLHILKTKTQPDVTHPVDPCGEEDVILCSSLLQLNLLSPSWLIH